VFHRNAAVLKISIEYYRQYKERERERERGGGGKGLRGPA